MTYEERRLLRKVVLNVHMQYFPKHMLNNREADKLIDSLITETVEELNNESKDKKVDQI